MPVVDASCDLVYVALAERLGERLVATDKRLRAWLGSLPFIVGPT